MITETIIAIKNRIEEITGLPVFVVDTKVAAYDKNAIYLVTPRGNDIRIKPFISTGFSVEYDLRIYQVVHVVDVSRQRDIGTNITYALDKGTDLMGKAFDITKGYRVIAGGNVVDLNLGTDTWVVNTTIYTSYDIRVTIRTIKDN